ncbi:MAG: hypothetical protein GY952_01815 [Rhodobacteraceae bacterium]|nr:hypothetical protein [Paracoccaceae bacterium]
MSAVNATLGGSSAQKPYFGTSYLTAIHFKPQGKPEQSVIAGLITSNQPDIGGRKAC